MIDSKVNFYDKFQCIADKCTMTCCQEWKISVDDETYNGWKNSGINVTTQMQDEIRVIKLNERKICPCLNEKGLCKIVLEHGENMISYTCQSFPRQIQEFEDYTEYSLAASCPAVVDFLNTKNPISFFNIRKDTALLSLRNRLISIIQNKNYSIAEAMLVIYYILEDLYDNETLNPDELKLNEESMIAAIRKMQFNDFHTFEERNELFLDLSEKYREEKLYEKYLEPIAKMADDIDKGYNKEKMKENLQNFEKQFKIYEDLFRNYLALEFYAGTVTPNGDLETMMLAVEWVAMEYVSMKHALLLKTLESPEKLLDYEDVREYIVVISRMTGYEEEDVWDYLENSFECIIWEWGYFALIIGNK